MRISIVIPCFNQAEYLPEAIESALAQTYEDTEIIVVNDGSPDATAEIATKYQLAHPFKIKVINQVNKGLASARNAAIMNMTGGYLLPLDSDDILLPSCVEKIVKKAKETNADVIAPSIRCFGIAVQDISLMPDPKLEDFKVGNRIAYCSAIKREALLEVGGYSPRMDKGWEDLHLWYDLLTRGKRIVTIPEPLVLYRTKKESMWTEARDKYKDVLQAQLDRDFPNLFV